jgi:hypothetical protein
VAQRTKAGLMMIKFSRKKAGAILNERGGLATWLLKSMTAGFGKREQRGSRLALVDRISLAPRQSLALVEAEGRRFLVATSLDGGPAFYALDALHVASPISAPPIPDGSPAAMTYMPKTHAVGIPARARARVSW